VRTDEAVCAVALFASFPFALGGCEEMEIPMPRARVRGALVGPGRCATMLGAACLVACRGIR